MTDIALEGRPLSLEDIPLARDLVPTDRRLLPCSIEDLNEGADILQAAGGFISKELRADRGACVAVAYMAALHGTDLVGTGSQAYSANGRLAFQAQYINALVQRHLASRPTYTYQGSSQTRAVHIEATPKGEAKALPYSSPQIGQIKVKNSPLWVSDPDQQLGYYGIRAWARRHMPDVLLGIYAVEELQQISVRDVTPAGPDPFANMDDLEEVEPEPDAEESQPFEPSGGFSQQEQEPTFNPLADDPLEWAELCKADAREASDEVALRTLWTANRPNRDALKRLDKTAFADLEAAFIDRQKELQASSGQTGGGSSASDGAGSSEP